MFELVLLSTFVIYGHLVVFYEKFIRQQITEETYATLPAFPLCLLPVRRKLKH